MDNTGKHQAMRAGFGGRSHARLFAAVALAMVVACACVALTACSGNGVGDQDQGAYVLTKRTLHGEDGESTYELEIDDQGNVLAENNYSATTDRKETVKRMVDDNGYMTGETTSSPDNADYRDSKYRKVEETDEFGQPTLISEGDSDTLEIEWYGEGAVKTVKAASWYMSYSAGKYEEGFSVTHHYAENGDLVGSDFGMQLHAGEGGYSESHADYTYERDKDGNITSCHVKGDDYEKTFTFERDEHGNPVKVFVDGELFLENEFTYVENASPCVRAQARLFDGQGEIGETMGMKGALNQ